jgi:hypothetical protein
MLFLVRFLYTLGRLLIVDIFHCFSLQQSWLGTSFTSRFFLRGYYFAVFVSQFLLRGYCLRGYCVRDYHRLRILLTLREFSPNTPPSHSHYVDCVLSMKYEAFNFVAALYAEIARAHIG